MATGRQVHGRNIVKFSISNTNYLLGSDDCLSRARSLQALVSFSGGLDFADPTTLEARRKVP